MHAQLPSHMRESVRRFAATKRSPRTAKTYGSIAEDFLRQLPGREPKRRDVEQFLAQPLEAGGRASIATYNQRLAALRAYAKFAVSQGTWRFDPTDALDFERGQPKDPAVLFVPEVSEFIRAVAQISPARECARNLAIVALSFTLGPRVSELMRLDCTQLDVATNTLLAVHRKGGRIQTLPMESRAAFLVRRWLEQRPHMARPDERALFVSCRGTRLSVRTIQRIYQRVREHLGLHKHVTPHTARHSFVTNELFLGAEVTVVSRLAGHASLTTTMRYRHLIETEPRKAVDLLGVAIPPELLPGFVNSRPLERQHRHPFVYPPTVPANDALDAQENLDADAGGNQVPRLGLPLSEPGRGSERDASKAA